MKMYVGLDVGLEETSVCIVDSEGLTVREVKVSTEPEAIRSALEGYADRLDRVGVEASSLGIWLYRELQAAGLPIIVVEARHMRVSLSTMRGREFHGKYGVDVADGPLKGVTARAVVVLDDSTVLMSSDAPQTAQLFRERGLEVLTTPISEFEKLEGCVTCLSVRVRD